MVFPEDAEIASQIAAFGTRMRAARERAGISQTELSERSGLHRAAVSLMEKGVRAPNLQTLLLVARSLRVRPQDLLGDTGGAPGPSSSSSESVSLGLRASFGENLRFARRKAGASQSRLGVDAGVDVMTISRYEAGRQQPNLRTVLKLARALAVDPAELLPATAEEAPLSPRPR